MLGREADFAGLRDKYAALGLPVDTERMRIWAAVQAGEPVEPDLDVLAKGDPDEAEACRVIAGEEPAGTVGPFTRLALRLREV